MDYDVISEELAKTWVKGCPNLSFIYLHADEYVDHTHVISCETWKSLVSTHPKLLVDFRGYNFQDAKQMPDILSAAIPLFKLSWQTYRKVTTESELTRLLNHVARYHRTIKHLYLGLLGHFPHLDTTAVQNILSKCKDLQPFQCTNETRTLAYEYTWGLYQDNWWI
ncbi:unnamed protein product [Lymnaea stagnalis]|uniref:Uncharacterized protein n=1 Tax=Lymnaea stagnalis TaxID=6523 RepID=A0AAV2H934_LYMST